MRARLTLIDIDRALADRTLVVTPREAVRSTVESGMADANGTGKGYKAARRAHRLGERAAAELEALAERMKRNARDMAAAAWAELREARTMRPFRVNFHE